MRHLIELAFDGGMNFRMPVAMDVRPDRGISVDVFTTMYVPKDCSLALNKDERFVLRRAPCLHLGEGMPQVSFICGEEVVVFHVGKSWAVDTGGSTTFSP